MKNETARREIESLDYYLQNYTDDYSEESHTAMMMAIKGLEQEPCEDAISRRAVLDLIADYDLSMGQVVKGIHALPPVTPQPKTGHWEQYENFWEDKFKCSECGKEQPKIICCGRIIGHWSDYCPNCGAKMESEV